MRIDGDDDRIDRLLDSIADVYESMLRSTGDSVVLDASGLIDAMPMACALLGDEQRCLGWNADFETVIRELALRIVDTRLRFTDPETQGRWLQGIELARSMPSPQSLHFASASGHAWALHLARLVAPAQTANGRRAPLVLIVCQRSRQSAAQTVRRFARHHRLTGAETDVLTLLCRSLSLPDIARERGCSMSTVRTHLARIFDKTGFRSQRKLMLAVRKEEEDRSRFRPGQ